MSRRVIPSIPAPVSRYRSGTLEANAPVNSAYSYRQGWWIPADIRNLPRLPAFSDENVS
jgi:hypothetical protein